MCLLAKLLFLALCGSVILGFKPLDFKNDNFNHFERSELKESEELIRERLPRVAEIQSYNLTIQLYFPFKGVPESERQDFTFDSNVTIHFTITNDSVTKFPFYYDGPDIVKTLLWEDEKPVDVKNVTVDIATTLGFVEINKKFEIGKKYRLLFMYHGVFRQNSVGLFHNEYEDENGEKRYLVATKFEPIFARQMFPCADDPHFKSKITLTLIHPALSKAYSNSEVEKEDTDASQIYKITTFKPSPLMSSYLLAFAVGDFYEISTKSKSGVPIRMISYNKPVAPKNAEIAAKCLDTMEKLTGVPYKHSKLDHIWIEHVGGSMAMENWGAIMYADEQLSPWREDLTLEQLYRLYSTVCHETSHQWFGNLVTNDRWGQEFLQEGFANYFENHVLLEYPEEIDPKYTEETILWDLARGLGAIHQGDDAIIAETARFTQITYAAGGAVIRMIEHVVGTDKFYEALKIYLTKHAFKTATYEDLISAFDEAIQNKPLCGDLKISEFICDFLLQAAYPNIYVKIEDQKFVFTQSASSGKSGLKWNVPLFVQEDNSTEKPQLIWALKNNTICSTESVELDPKKKYNFNVDVYSFASVEQP